MSARFDCEGIGTKWWFELLDQPTFPAHLKTNIRTTIDQFNKDYSRFVPSSYIGRLNTLKVVDHPPSELRDMLLFARDMFYESKGSFNVSIGGKLHAQGYGTRELAAVIDEHVWDKITIDDNRITIPENVVVDNGGFGKGWLIDKLGKVFRNNGYDQFIINGGGDMLVSSDTPIQIGLEDPSDTSKLIGSIRISRGALAASSNNKRQWTHDGETFSHIIDPRFGHEASVFPSGTFVKADTALMADTMATILLIEPQLKEQLSLRHKFSAMILL